MQIFKYREIMDLGFNEQIENDKVYYDRYGFDYAVITKDLTKKIHLLWEKETRHCKMILADKHSNILAEIAIDSMKQLKDIIQLAELGFLRR